MYESFFRLHTRPFVAAPLVTSYFPSASAECARQTLIRAVDRAEGPGLIIGPAGVGKTLLCRVLAARFQQTFQVAMLSSTRIITRKALLQNILFELGLPYRDMEEGELRLALLDHLQPHEGCPDGILLIVDEAHLLPLRLLEEIRMITNLVRDGQPRVRLVMAGSGKLDEKFASPKLTSFNQRIAARCYLEPFSQEDTIDYVQSRLGAAGGNIDSIFDATALRAIYQATDGIPRLVNQVCDHALVMAFAGGLRQIDAAGIEEAWADLQQLPGPWSEAAAAGPAESAIEFGELEPELHRDPVAYGFDEPVTISIPQFGSHETFDLHPAAEAIDDVDEQIDPEPTATPLTIAAVRDPFGDGFDEEEIVIDQTVIRSAEIFANRPRVNSREGRELVASLLDEEEVELLSTPTDPPSPVATQPAPQVTPVTLPIEPTSPATADAESSPRNSWQHLPEMFEYTAFEPNDLADLALEALCDVNMALGDLYEGHDNSNSNDPIVKLMDHRRAEVDDRDMIVIEAESELESPGLGLPVEAAARRVDYQDLFAQLRHG